MIAEHPAGGDVFVYGVTGGLGRPGREGRGCRHRARGSRQLFADPPTRSLQPAAEGLESNFVPSYLQLVDEIPKTASEKPQERFLLAAFEPHGPDTHTE